MSKPSHQPNALATVRAPTPSPAHDAQQRALDMTALDWAELDRVTAAGSKPGGTGDGVSGNTACRNA